MTQSAGNDIIDLGTINRERSSDRNFYKKILSDSEQILYQKCECKHLLFEEYLWLSWSIKESVYKYLKRCLPDLVFSPLKIIIRDLAIPADHVSHSFTEKQWEGNAGDEHCYAGSVIFENFILHFKSKIYSELIATIISEDDSFKNIFWGIQTIATGDTDYQSKSVRFFLLNKLKCIFPDKDLQIKKNSLGYPFVTNGLQALKIPISFAHHERYIAYTFLLFDD